MKPGYFEEKTQDFKNILESRGYHFLEGEYLGTHKKSFTIQCSQGHIYLSSWDNFVTKNSNCKECFEVKMKLNLIGKPVLARRISKEKADFYVKNSCFPCQLIDIVFEERTFLIVECERGHVSKRRPDMLLKDQCNSCFYEDARGVNSVHYKPNKSREIRQTCESIYKNWRNQVFERDLYACQFCQDNRGKNLEAHHISGWKDFPDQRYEVSNGVTLCKICHNKYHSFAGGSKVANRQSFDRWISHLVS